MSTKIYSWHGNPRGDIARIAADFAKVDYEFVNVAYADLKSKEHLERHPLGKVPLLETPEGNLFETNAILKYFGRKANLLGSGAFEEAQVQQWLDYINSDLLTHYFPVWASVLGHREFNEESYKASRAELFKVLKYINEYLNHHTYLAGEQLTVADVCLYVWLHPLFSTVLDENFRRGHFSLARWFKHIGSFAPLKKSLRSPYMCKTAWFNVKAEKPAQKPKQEQKPKKQEKKAEKKVEKKEEAPPKPKDPLAALPESPFNFFDFKTFIVNEKDKKKGVEEFFKQYDPEGYSIYHIKYDKYEGEGEKLFLTSNLKDNFLQRLDNFRKYAFGTYGVYGEEGKYDVQGIWVWRGVGIPQQIKDLPNYDYHFWTKLDHTKEEDRKRVEAYWTGLEEDVAVVDGQVARDVTLFK